MSYYWDHEKEAIERRIDSDLASNVEYNGGADTMPGFRLEDVAYVLAYLQGEHDGPRYHWIIAMKDHTYAYAAGSCDYTGWDCGSDGEATIVVSLREAMAKVKSDQVAKLLQRQLIGINSFGESTPGGE